MVPDPHAPKDPFSGKPNPPKLGLLFRGIFAVAMPVLLIWPIYVTLTRLDGPNVIVICVLSMASSLFAAWRGIRDIVEYRRRRAALEDEMRDYRAALARAVDFTKAD